MSLVHRVSLVWTEYRGETDPQDNLDSKESPPEKASRVNVDFLETLVSAALLERGAPLVCQASADQESQERRAVKGGQDFLELLD